MEGATCVTEARFPIGLSDIQHVENNVTENNLRDIVGKINYYAADFHINTREEMVHFLTQTSFESGGYGTYQEGLNYSSVKQLCGNMPDWCDGLRSKGIDPQRYVHNPAGLDQARYSGYHGRGMIQLTWQDAYQSFGRFTSGFSDWADQGLAGSNPDFVQNPDVIANVLDYNVVSAMWFMTSVVPEKLRRRYRTTLQDATCDQVSVAVNGGGNSPHQRERIYQNLLNWFRAHPKTV